MHGPVWNNPNTGVTGEKNFSNTPPNYVTVTDPDGTVRTLVGEAPDEHRKLNA